MFWASFERHAPFAYLQVDASITYEIGKTREIESALVLCEDEVRSWEDEEQKLLTEHCTFAVQAEDFENLKSKGPMTTLIFSRMGKCSVSPSKTCRVDLSATLEDVTQRDSADN